MKNLSLSLSLCLLALVLSISACEKDKFEADSTQQNLGKPSLALEDLSPEVKQRLLFGPEGNAIANLNLGELEARNDDPRIESLVELYVSHYNSEESLNTDLTERGYPSWSHTLLPGEGYGENVFVIPVIEECELKGNYFVFQDTEKPLADHRMDYYSYSYTDMGYMYGGYFMSDEEMRALYMVAGGQATSQYVLLGTVDTAAVLFRHYVSEAGGIGGELAGRTTSCSILYCEGLETSLPPVIADHGDPNAGGSGGGGGSWPPQVGPGAPGWHNGTYGSTAQGWGGSGSGVNINWRPITRFFGNVVGGAGGFLDGIGDWFKRRLVKCYQFRIQPDIKDRLDEVSKQVSNLAQRSGNCRWIQVHGIEDISMYTYLGNSQLGDDWGDGINGFACRGIAFENEAMGIDFAFSIRNILAAYDFDWEMIDCLASNAEYAAAVNFALDHYKDATTCDGSSIEDYLAADMEAFCSGSGNPSAGDELMSKLGGEDWIDDFGLNKLDGTPKCPCLNSILNELRTGQNTDCVDFGLDFFEGNTGNNIRFEYGLSTDNVLTISGPNNPAPLTAGVWPAGRPALTSYSTDGTIIIALDPNLCNGQGGSGILVTGYQTAATLLHETRHAVFNEVFNDMDNLVPNWGGMVRNNYYYSQTLQGQACASAAGSHHKDLLITAIEEIAMQLRALDNNRGELEAYMWPAGIGLIDGGDGIWKSCALEWYSEATLNNWLQKHNDHFNQHGDINVTGCP